MEKNVKFGRYREINFKLRNKIYFNRTCLQGRSDGRAPSFEDKTRNLGLRQIWGPRNVGSAFCKISGSYQNNAFHIKHRILRKSLSSISLLNWFETFTKRITTFHLSKFFTVPKYITLKNILSSCTSAPEFFTFSDPELFMNGHINLTWRCWTKPLYPGYSASSRIPFPSRPRPQTRSVGRP